MEVCFWMSNVQLFLQYFLDFRVVKARNKQRIIHVTEIPNPFMTDESLIPKPFEIMSLTESAGNVKGKHVEKYWRTSGNPCIGQIIPEI